MNTIKSKVKEQAAPLGIVTVYKIKAEGSEYLEVLNLDKQIMASSDHAERTRLRQEAHFAMERFLAHASEKKQITHQIKRKNLVVTTGLARIVEALASNLTTLSEVEINVAALGDSATTPAAGDTTLTSEVFRKTITSVNFNNGSLFATMLVDYLEDSDTYYETGLFIDANPATPDDGVLFNHALLEPPTGVTKTTSEVLVVSYQITFTSV